MGIVASIVRSVGPGQTSMVKKREVPIASIMGRVVAQVSNAEPARGTQNANSSVNIAVLPGVP